MLCYAITIDRAATILLAWQFKLDQINMYSKITEYINIKYVYSYETVTIISLVRFHKIYT